MTRFALLLTVFALLLASAAPATAVIRPQKGMAGITLDMTQAQVREKLGTPRIERGRNAFGRYTLFVYRSKRLTVIFQGNRRVTTISTTGRSERTTRDVGVGSSERAVKRLVRGVRCETFGDIRSCHVGSFTPGRRVTDFLIRGGKVIRVSVGYVID